MPEFLAYYFRCIRQFIIACGKYTTIPIINQEETKNLPVILPKLREQESIVDYIKRKNSEIDSAILRAEREIELIREYRTRLIADVVTGKVDVRDIPVEESPDSIDIEKPEEFDPSLETAEPAGPQENPDEND